MKASIWMKMYEIYFKKYINMIYKIVHNSRPNMHRFKNLGPNMHGLLDPGSVGVAEKPL
jgi:hypothetical protein